MMIHISGQKLRAYRELFFSKDDAIFSELMLKLRSPIETVAYCFRSRSIILIRFMFITRQTNS